MLVNHKEPSYSVAAMKRTKKKKQRFTQQLSLDMF